MLKWEVLIGPVDQTALEKRRIEAVRLFEKGFFPAEVARQLCVHRQSTSRWRKEWLAGGENALKSKGKIGRRSGLRTNQIEELRQILLAGPEAAGQTHIRWTLQRVAQVIRDQFGISYHPSHVGRIIAAAGIDLKESRSPKS